MDIESFLKEAVGYYMMNPIVIVYGLLVVCIVVFLFAVFWRGGNGNGLD